MTTAPHERREADGVEMAKKSKKEKAQTKTESSGAPAAPAKARKKAKSDDLAAAAKKVKAKAADLASNPLVAEVVAATLVAAAAAIKDPKKARQIAASAGDELGKAVKGAEAGGALWLLAMDVARRSVAALAEGGKEAATPKKKSKKKD
jgi:hypothetical protein